MFERELQIARELALTAGDAILKIFHDGFEVERKDMGAGYTEPVTIADKTSSKIIVAGLTDSFPEDAILSEEEVDDVERRTSSSRVWVVDPLDGTQGFTEREGDFAVQIALVENGHPVVGVVYQPIGEIMYEARQKSGSYCTVEGSDAAPISVSERIDFEQMTLAVSRSHRSGKMNRIHEHFRFERELPHGSVGLKVGFVARRMADCYIHLSPHTKFWDTAAPQIILEEAGGRLTDIFGSNIDYTLADVKNHNGVLATNGAVHNRTVNHLKPLLTEFGRLKVIAKTGSG